MRILLVLPPEFFPETPYLSLAALAGYLKRYTHHFVEQRDANLEFATHCLRPDRIARARQRIGRFVRGFEDRGGATHAMERLLYVRSARLLAQTVALSISLEQAPRWLHAPFELATFPEKRRAHVHYHLARALLAAEFYPGMDAPQRIDWPHVSKHLADETHNPYLEFYDGTLIPSVQAGEIDLVGISVAFESQLIPGLTLARRLREKSDARVVLGGPYVTHLRDRIARIPDLLGLPHAWVLYEGEEALLQLAEAFESGGDLATIPNLLYAAAGPEGPEIRSNPILPLSEFRTQPVPDYKGVFQRRYFAFRSARAPNFQLLFSSGCYWGQCTFCTHPQVSSTYHLMAPGDSIYRQVCKLVEEHAARRFVFQDAAIPLGPLRRFARQVVGSGPAIEWAGTMHLERSIDSDFCRLLKRSGCRILSTGLESGSQEILDRMQKGYRLDQFERIADAIVGSGIALRLSMIFGFPGEGEEEREETIALVTRLFRKYNRERIIFYCDFNEFQLEESAEVGRDPSRFGIAYRQRYDPTTHLGREVVEITNIDSQACQEAIDRVNRSFCDHILQTPTLRKSLLSDRFENIFFDDSPTEFTRIVLDLIDRLLSEKDADPPIDPDDLVQRAPGVHLHRPRYDVATGAGTFRDGTALTLAVTAEHPERIVPLMPEIEELLLSLDEPARVGAVIRETPRAPRRGSPPEDRAAAGAARLAFLEYLKRHGLLRTVRAAPARGPAAAD